MEPIASQSAVRKTYNGLISTILFVLAYFIARVILKQAETAETLRVLAALLPVAPFIWMLWEIVKGIRGLDELEQRIQLEALAVAFPLSLILLMTLGLLEIAIQLPPEDLSYRHVWALLPLFYFIGLIMARRRYK
jgi:DMSO/TMAO reductase YedYZ heme-binding membrane subunit